MLSSLPTRHFTKKDPFCYLCFVRGEHLTGSPPKFVVKRRPHL